jgi:hypothetical protein
MKESKKKKDWTLNYYPLLGKSRKIKKLSYEEMKQIMGAV